MYEHVKQRWYRVHKDPNECTHLEASHVRTCHPIFGVCVVAGVDQARALPPNIVVKVVLEGIGELLASSVTLWSHNTRKNVQKQEINITIVIPILYFSG